MKTLSLYKGVLLAFVSILILTVPTVVFGVNCDKNPTHRNCLVDPPPPPPDDGGSGNLAAEFCLDTDTGSSIRTDEKTVAGYDYCHSKDERVSIVTGSGPGFNFESHTRRNGTWVRWVYVDFPGTGITAIRDIGDNHGDLDTFYDGNYEIVYRFEQDLGGLDFGGIEVGKTDYVSIWMAIETADGKKQALMAHGSAPDPATSGHLNDNACITDAITGEPNTKDAVVTRTGDTTWTIESYPGEPNVCLWDKNGGYEFQRGVPVYMPYKFEITIK
jgi:hypothetical protein